MPSFFLKNSRNQLESYCKKQQCIKAENIKTLKLSSAFNNNQISSKMKYSQDVRNTGMKYTSTYSNLLNSNNVTALLCSDANSQTTKSTTIKNCKTITSSKTATTSSVYLRNYITAQVNLYFNNQLVNNGIMQKYIIDITNLYSENSDKPFVQIVNNYIYLVIKSNFEFSPIIQYMIIDNTYIKIGIKRPETTDEGMKIHIQNIIHSQNMNPTTQISQIINNYISTL